MPRRPILRLPRVRIGLEQGGDAGMVPGRRDVHARFAELGRLFRRARIRILDAGGEIVQTLLYTQLANGDQNIFTAPLKGRGKDSVQLTNTGKDYAACWSPDAQWIVFTSDRDDNSEVYIMDASGQNVTNLTNHPGLDKDPAWQPPQPQQ